MILPGLKMLPRVENRLELAEDGKSGPNWRATQGVRARPVPCCVLMVPPNSMASIWMASAMAVRRATLLRSRSDRGTAECGPGRHRHESERRRWSHVACSTSWTPWRKRGKLSQRHGHVLDKRHRLGAAPQPIKTWQGHLAQCQS